VHLARAKLWHIMYETLLQVGKRMMGRLSRSVINKSSIYNIFYKSCNNRDIIPHMLFVHKQDNIANNYHAILSASFQPIKVVCHKMFYGRSKSLPIVHVRQYLPSSNYFA